MKGDLVILATNEAERHRMFGMSACATRGCAGMLTFVLALSPAMAKDVRSAGVSTAGGRRILAVLVDNAGIQRLVDF